MSVAEIASSLSVCFLLLQREKESLSIGGYLPSLNKGHISQLPLPINEAWVTKFWSFTFSQSAMVKVRVRSLKAGRCHLLPLYPLVSLLGSGKRAPILGPHRLKNYSMKGLCSFRAHILSYTHVLGIQNLRTPCPNVHKTCTGLFLQGSSPRDGLCCCVHTLGHQE